MTHADPTTPPTGGAPAVVAESLSTVGYAMFALLNTGPLDQIPSIHDVVARFHTEEPTPAVADLDAVDQPQGDAAPAFTEPPVSLDAALYESVTVEDAPVPVPAAVAPVAPVAPVPPVEAYPQPKDPIEALPAYTGHHTLAMLQEISFLDE